MQQDRKVRITEDTSSVILSFENSPLTADVHRCLTGADFLSLPQTLGEEQLMIDTTESECTEQRSMTSESASSESDSLTNRVASLLNRSGEYHEISMRSDSKPKTPLASAEMPGVASGSADVNFNTGSFLTSSRVAQNSFVSSPPRTAPYSFYKSAGGSVEDLVAPPPEFADPSYSGSAPKYSSGSAVQTLLKSLEWDHAWDVSAPTGYPTRSSSALRSPTRQLGNSGISAEAGRTDRRSSPGPRSSPPKHVLFDDDVSMARNKPRSSPQYTPSTSPDLSTGKYFSEMKHLVEEQMQRRQALFEPLLHGDFSSTSASRIPAGPSSYSSTVTAETSPSRYFGVNQPSTSTDTLVGPRYESTFRDYSSYDFQSSRLPPAGPSKTGDKSYLRPGLDANPRLTTDEFRSRLRAFDSGRLSASQSDLTTVTPRTGSGLSHHHHDLRGFELHSRVADILARRGRASEGTSYSDEQRSSSNQSGEATTTIESTHPGSNDAIPPRFPPNTYGNRPARPYSARDHSARLDAAVQTSASRLPAAWVSESGSENLPRMVSSGAQTSASRQPLTSRSNIASSNESAAKPKLSTAVPAAPVDINAIAGLLEEPIRAAVRKCLETELRAVSISDRTSRPNSRASLGNRRSPSAHVDESNTGRTSSLSRHRSTERGPTPVAPEPISAAANQIERVLEAERRVAEMAKAKADEQAKRVKQLEEALASQLSAPPPPMFDETINSTIENVERPRSRKSRSPSPSVSRHNRSTSPIRSPPRARVPSPVAWFVTTEPGAHRRKEKRTTDPNRPAVRMDFAAPTRKEHNFLTGRIQGMLEPVSPTKPKDELTLQESLRLTNRNFIVRSTERLRRLRLHAIERKLDQERKKASAAIEIERDDFLDEQARKLEKLQATRRAKSPSPPRGIQRSQTARAGSKPQQPKLGPKSKTTEEILFAELLACDTASIASTTPEMKRIRAETHRRALQLPEAIRRMEQERRALQAKQNRLRSEIFKQKVLNKLLGRKKWTLPRCLYSDSVLDRVLIR